MTPPVNRLEDHEILDASILKQRNGYTNARGPGTNHDDIKHFGFL